MSYRLLFWIGAGFLLPGYTNAQPSGCTDPLALNYQPEASINDGSCLYAEASVTPASSWNLPAILRETSGLLWFNDAIWTHNDDTDTNLYQLDTGQLNAFFSYALPGTANIDWEDIAQDEQFIYIGDVGNNANGNRTDLKILRIEKNSLLQLSPLIDTIRFSYDRQITFEPAGPNNTNFDCEAFIVAGDSLYLFTKEWIDQQSSLYSLPKTPGNHVALLRDRLPVQGLVTGASYNAGRRMLVLCGYSTFLQPFLYLLYDFSAQDFFAANKRKINLTLPFHQIEGITTPDGYHYFVSNERFSQSFLTVPEKLHRLDLSPFVSNYYHGQTRTDEQAVAPNFQVYPNPAGSLIHITGPDARTYSYQLFNVAAQLLKTGEFTGQTTVDLSFSLPGMYILRIFDGQEVSHLTIVSR